MTKNEQLGILAASLIGLAFSNVPHSGWWMFPLIVGVAIGIVVFLRFLDVNG